MKTVLHTEASLGFGGQEIRIWREAQGMRDRGWNVILAAPAQAKLLQAMQSDGFTVYSINFSKKSALISIFKLIKIIITHKIKLINTHSSLDAWIAGVAARLARVPLLRTRHLSTAIRPGLNSILLYNWLADRVVTTCEEIVPKIRSQARLSNDRCLSVPTGVDPASLIVGDEEVTAFRASWGIAPTDIVVGTLCVLRWWKGVDDLLKAAVLFRRSGLKWLIVGEGPQYERHQREAKEWKVDDCVIFTGHLPSPQVALKAIDIFVLLSIANEGVSQSVLQAAFLKKPLITTATGGLKELCIDGVTGYLVEPRSPRQVADAVAKLLEADRRRIGEQAFNHVMQGLTLERMLEKMSAIYEELLKK